MTETTITHTDSTIAGAQLALKVAEGQGEWAKLDIAARRAIVTSLGEVRTEIARLDEVKKQLEEILRTKIEGEEADEVAGFAISTSPNRTLDKAAIATDYPVGKFPQLYKQEPDLTALKRNIAPAELDLYYKHGEPRLNFKAL